jgi:thiol:disulfide interchange protein DsbG
MPLYRFRCAAALAAACLVAALPAHATEPAPVHPTTRPAAVASADARWDRLGQAHWLKDGRDDAARTVYVFTDPNCPYCTKLWSDARPWVDGGRVQLRHIVVGVLTPSSPGKAAALLGDKAPAAALDAYERAHAFTVATRIASGHPHALDDAGLQPLAVIPPALAAELAANESLMTSLGIQGTPGVVWLDDRGVLHAQSGIAPGQLARVLGPR